MGGPGSRTWTSEHPHNDRKIVQGPARARIFLCPRPCNWNCQARGLRCPWIGQQSTSRIPRESRSVRLVRSYSDRVACGRLAHQRAKTHPDASSAQPSRATQRLLGVNTRQNHRQSTTAAAAVMHRCNICDDLIISASFFFGGFLAQQAHY